MYSLSLHCWSLSPLKTAILQLVSCTGPVGWESLLGGTRQGYFLPQRFFLSLLPSILQCWSILMSTLLWCSCPLLPTDSTKWSRQSTGTKVANKGGDFAFLPQGERNGGSYPRIHSYRAIKPRKQSLQVFCLIFKMKTIMKYFLCIF